MPTFDTPAPIQIRIDALRRLACGSARATAPTPSSRCAPATRAAPPTRQAAEQTRVEFADGRLLVTVAPPSPAAVLRRHAVGRHRRSWSPRAPRLEVSSTAGDVDCEGRLGDVRIDNRYGDIRIDRASTLRARTSAGDITVRGRSTRTAEAGTSYGEIRVREAAGALRLDSACGDITVDRALASVGASTKYGQVQRPPGRPAARWTWRPPTARSRPASREGTAAWLDLESASGKVRNLLTPSDAPDGSDEPAAHPRPHVLRRHRRPARLTTPHLLPLRQRAEPCPCPAPAISITGLRKSYGDHVVLDGLDLSVPEGSVFALLGPNGAGKTTTVDILSTLSRRRRRGGPRRRATTSAREPDAVRAAIAVTGQFSAVDNLLTGDGEPAADGRPAPPRPGRGTAPRSPTCWSGSTSAEAARQARSPTYSGGMRRRLDLAMGLVGDPRVVFLDEPTTGLDPRSRRAMWEIVRGLVADGVTILLTTQYLEEADQLADRIGVLDGGPARRRGHGRGAQAAGPRRPRPAARSATGPDSRPPPRAARPTRRRPADSLTLAVPSDGSLPALQVAARAGSTTRRSRSPASTVHTPDLDDVFLALTGRPTNETVPIVMTTLAYALSDSATMLRRNLRRAVRYPGADRDGRRRCRSCSCCCSSSSSAARSAPGSAAPAGGRAEYVDYVTPASWSSPSPAPPRARPSRSPWT